MHVLSLFSITHQPISLHEPGLFHALRRPPIPDIIFSCCVILSATSVELIELELPNMFVTTGTSVFALFVHLIVEHVTCVSWTIVPFEWTEASSQALYPVALVTVIIVSVKFPFSMEISFIKFSFVNLSSFVYQTASSMVSVIQSFSLITFAIMIPFRSKTSANPLFKLTSKNLLSVYYREPAVSLRISVEPCALIIIVITPRHFNSSLLKCIILPHSIFKVSV